MAGNGRTGWAQRTEQSLGAAPTLDIEGMFAAGSTQVPSLMLHGHSQLHPSLLCASGLAPPWQFSAPNSLSHYLPRHHSSAHVAAAESLLSLPSPGAGFLSPGSPPSSTAVREVEGWGPCLFWTPLRAAFRSLVTWTLRPVSSHSLTTVVRSEIQAIWPFSPEIPGAFVWERRPPVIIN